MQLDKKSNYRHKNCKKREKEVNLSTDVKIVYLFLKTQDKRKTM